MLRVDNSMLPDMLRSPFEVGDLDLHQLVSIRMLEFQYGLFYAALAILQTKRRDPN